MALTQKLTTSIRQTSDSCLMISYSIILNYYSSLTADQIFKSFLELKDDLFNKYSIDRNAFKGLSLECQFVLLYFFVAKASNGQEQFSNAYIESTLKPIADSFQVDTKWVDIKEDAECLKNILTNEEACLSLSCTVTNLQGQLQWHATPIAFDTEFYTVHNGNYLSLGQDFMNIKQVLNANDVGDGILFQKRV